MNTRCFGLGLALVTGALGISGRAAAAPIAKGPWVQKVTSTSAEVRVELTAPGPLSVELASEALDASSPRRIESAEARTLHRIPIGGLAPGTRYPFTIRARGEASAGSFTTAPRDDSEAPFQFSIYGDNRSDDASHAAVVRRMAERKTDLLVHTGDFVEDGGDLSQWQRFFEIEAPLLRDRFLASAVGNHELVDGAGSQYAQYFGPGDAPTGRTLGPAELDGTFRWGNTRFFLLNGMVPYRAGPDRAWLEKVLADADAEPGITWRVVVTHHAPWSSGPHGDNVYFRDARIPELLRAHKVDLVLGGHDHIYERGVEGRLAYLISGGGGAPTYRIKNPKPSAKKLESVRHFILATVEKTAIKIETVRIDGSIVERCGLTKEGWDCDGPGTADPSAISPGEPEKPKSKCGCRTPGVETEAGPLGLASLAALVAIARRKRRASTR